MYVKAYFVMIYVSEIAQLLFSGFSEKLHLISLWSSCGPCSGLKVVEKPSGLWAELYLLPAEGRAFDVLAGPRKWGRSIGWIRAACVCCSCGVLCAGR